MKQISALFFPETLPLETELIPLLLFCDTVSHYALPPLPEEAWRESLAKAGLCAGYNPVLLAEEEQNRFQALVRDLKGHEGEFYGGALASLAVGMRDREEAATWSLASRLRAGTAPMPREGTEQETLWQAMLLLKLAEMLAEEEREIAQGLAAISNREADLLAALKGEQEADGEEELELENLIAQQAVSGPALNLERLTRAWAALYLQDGRREEHPLLATSHPELHALLADTHETLTGKSPRELLRLPLPVVGAASEKFPALRDKHLKAREELALLMAEIAAGGVLSPEILTAFDRERRKLAQSAAPTAQDDTERTLTLYAYEGASFALLFAKLRGREQPPAEIPAPQLRTGLLAVLS
ncbi:hypothetical protein ACUUL3_12045 [Thiovibrio sp. JS02]